MFQFLLGVKIAPRETEDDGYAKLWGDKQRALWYVMVFSRVVDSSCLLSSCILFALVILLGSSTINVIGTNTTNCLQNWLSLAVYEELTGVFANHKTEKYFQWTITNGQNKMKTYDRQFFNVSFDTF